MHVGDINQKCDVILCGLYYSKNFFLIIFRLKYKYKMFCKVTNTNDK